MKNLIILVFSLAVLAACNSKPSQTKEELASAPDTIQTVLHVNNMTCNHCEMTVEGGVKELAGIVSVKASYLDSTTTIKYDASKVSLASISQAIEKKGYKVEGEVKN